MPRLKSYHFDCGNSNVGPIGFCARVRATSKAKALNALQEVLWEEHEVMADDGEIEYLTVYFNAANVSVKDIDDYEDLL